MSWTGPSRRWETLVQRWPYGMSLTVIVACKVHQLRLGRQSYENEHAVESLIVKHRPHTGGRLRRRERFTGRESNRPPLVSPSASTSVFSRGIRQVPVVGLVTDPRQS